MKIKLNNKIIILLFILINSSVMFSKINFFKDIKAEIKLKKDINHNLKSILKPGKYEIIIYELKYPKDLIGKNDFYIKLNNILINENLNGKKYTFLFDKYFYNEMENLKLDKLSETEKILKLPPSSLTNIEKENIHFLSNELENLPFKGTDQELLNRQVYILYKLLQKDDYIINNIYSELDKEILISELKEFRKKIINNFEKLKFEFFLKEGYEKLKKEEDNKYLFDKEIILDRNFDDLVFSELDDRIYIENLPKEVVNSIQNKKIILNKKILLLENEEFHGYTYNDDKVVIFINGKKPIYYYDNYNIDVIKIEIDINGLKNIDSKNYISDFFIN